MSERLASAPEDTRSRLEAQVEEAEAELVRARARARELRQSLAIAREFAGIGASIQRDEVSAPRAAPPHPRRSRLDLTNTPSVTPPPALSMRRRAALEGLRRARHPQRERASFSPDVVLRWEDESPFAGTYTGRKAALALLELLVREVDPNLDPEATLRADGDAIRIDARPALWHHPGTRLALSAAVRFDGRDRIVELTVTPQPGDALDRLIDGVIG